VHYFGITPSVATTEGCGLWYVKFECVVQPLREFRRAYHIDPHHVTRIKWSCERLETSSVLEHESTGVRESMKNPLAVRRKSRCAVLRSELLRRFRAGSTVHEVLQRNREAL
jgi:hypothetical protein